MRPRQITRDAPAPTPSPKLISSGVSISRRCSVQKSTPGSADVLDLALDPLGPADGAVAHREVQSEAPSTFGRVSHHVVSPPEHLGTPAGDLHGPVPPRLVGRQPSASRPFSAYPYRNVNCSNTDHIYLDGHQRPDRHAGRRGRLTAGMPTRQEGIRMPPSGSAVPSRGRRGWPFVPDIEWNLMLSGVDTRYMSCSFSSGS